MKLAIEAAFGSQLDDGAQVRRRRCKVACRERNPLARHRGVHWCENMMQQFVDAHKVDGRRQVAGEDEWCNIVANKI